MGVDVAYFEKADRIRLSIGRGCCCFVGGNDWLYWAGGASPSAFFLSYSPSPYVWVGGGGRFISHVGRYRSEDCHYAGGNPGESYNQCDWRAVFSLVNCTGSWFVALAAVDISVALNGKDIVSKVSLEAADGCITALVGPNGAGKTTLRENPCWRNQG